MSFPFTEWEDAYNWQIPLFRVLREHDNAEEGFYATNPNANLTINHHVCKGKTSRVRSQYISITQDLSTALRWVINERSALAVIYPPLLDEGIEILDLSEGSEELNDFGNRMAINHSEALIYPYVNAEAIGDVYSFGDLWRINNKIYHSKAKRDLLPNCFDYIIGKANDDLYDIEQEQYEEQEYYGKGWYEEEEEEEYWDSEPNWNYYSDSYTDSNSNSDSDYW
ncbi:hypothetical protein BGZ46_007167 [Entomortierella lignicola]|nr:hypothetical protein BGZ46_007167 [Entomortierella lignicola]